MKLLQMDSELNTLLTQNAIEADSDSFTHLTTCNTIKRWVIKPNHQTDFWKGYCHLVSTNKSLCLAERILPEIPIIVQLKLKFDIDNEVEAVYDDNFLEHVCHIYQSVIIETLEIDDDEHVELIVSVLESSSHYFEIDPVTKRKHLSMDIRLHFPFARTNVGIQKRTIRPRAIKLLNETRAFDKLKHKPIGGWSQILSDDFDSPITMYGSTENVNQPKLMLTHNWHLITKEMIDQELEIDELGMESIFFPAYHKSVQDGIIEEFIFEENENIAFWLPIIFSLDYWPTTLSPKIDDGGRFIKEVKENPLEFSGIGKSNWSSFPTEDSTIKICEDNISLMNKERYYEEPSWLDMGKAFNHCTKANESGLNLWLKYTQNVIKSSNREIPKYMTTLGDVERTMRALYRTFAGKPITEKTPGHYARIDKPEEYANWHMASCAHAISKALNGSHSDVANAAAKVYWLDLSYCPITDRWLIFKDGKWIHDVKALFISNYLSGDFVKRLEITKQNILTEMRNSNDEDVIENGNSTILKVDALIMKLKNGPFKDQIIKELRTKLLNHKFDKCCDANPNILGLANGVLEVVGGNIHFRAAKPEDYVLMNTRIAYDDTLTWESQEVVKCMAWMAQTFPDPDLRKHFLKFAASCIKGRNSDKIFPIFTGEGNNSKSMIVKLFMQTFGEYAIKLDMANFTGRNNNAGNASPHMARSKSVRLALADEAADDVPMHKETIKRIVGGDSFYTRKLHDNGGDIEVFFKLILSCNKVPIIPKADTAIKNRVKIFPYLGTWTSDASKWGEPNTYELKETFEDDIPGMVPAFLWIIVQYFPIYSTEKLKDPEIVTKYTEDYWRDNDVYAQFAADCVRPSNSKDAKVPFTEIYSKFRFWWKDSFDGVKMPEKPIIKRDMQARWGHLVGKYFLGITLLEDEYGAQPVQQKPVVHQQSAVQVSNTNVPIINVSSANKENPQETNLMSVEEMEELENIIETIKQPKTPESVKHANNFKEKLRTNKHIQESIGDIPTRLWSPGIMSGVSGEVNLEDEGAVDI